ncbi:MAG: hypothetical protein ACLFRX_06830 [Gemmatimonadota bacterium]
MQHLTLEALARLVDEAPDAHEGSHLAACEACRGELEALRRQTEALGTLPKILPAPDAWPEVSRRLRREGVVARAATRAGRLRAGPALTRVAASLVLFLAGGAGGYLLRGEAASAGPPAIEVAAAAESPSLEAAAAESSTLEAAAAESPTLEAEVERTEEAFFAALDRYMRTTGATPPDPAARLAVLDNIVLTTAEALAHSPTDPVINSFHVTAVAQQRELRRRFEGAAAEPVF